MVHAAVGVMLFAAVMLLTAVLFTGWVVVRVCRWMLRMFMGGPSTSMPRGVLDTRLCVRDRCRAANPVQAQFCRRCGTAVNGAANADRRVAV